jgi:hypothetical protein
VAWLAVICDASGTGVLYGLRLAKAIPEFIFEPRAQACFLPQTRSLGMLPAHEPH